MEAPGQRVRHIIGGLQLREFAQALAELFAKRIVAERRARHADDRKGVGKALAARQPVQRREQLAPGEVPGCAEDHQDRRPGRRLDPETVAERVGVYRQC